MTKKEKSIEEQIEHAEAMLLLKSGSIFVIKAAATLFTQTVKT